jgi:hypothetical protein
MIEPQATEGARASRPQSSAVSAGDLSGSDLAAGNLVATGRDARSLRTRTSALLSTVIGMSSGGTGASPVGSPRTGEGACPHTGIDAMRNNAASVVTIAVQEAAR